MKPIKIANTRLFEHDSAEKIIGETHRHWIGVWLTFLAAAVLIILLAGTLIVLRNNEELLTDTLGMEVPFNLVGLLSVLFAVALILVAVGAWIAVYIYKHNYLVLTDKKLVVVRNFSVVNRKVSQLSIGDIQDVSVAQKSIMSRIFKYGTLLIETAGEQANLRMTMISEPFDVGKAIVDSHENNMKLYGN